ncbi:MAG: sodium ion-translocating decarboxylase subunit beta [Gammaproteobacteria bacterium]
MGVGAMTDFGPLLANPKTLLLGAAAQFGIFAALLGALALTKLGIGIDFSLADAASIRYHRRCGWPDGDLCHHPSGAGFVGCDCGCGVFLHGAGAVDPATHHAGTHH